MHGMRELAEMATQVFAAGLWQGTAVVLLLSLVFRLVPRVSAAARSAVWVCAFALLLAVPLLSRGGEIGSAATGAAHATGLPAGQHIFRLGMAWGYGLLVVWAALVALRAVRLVVHGARLHGVWRRALPIKGVNTHVAALLRGGTRPAQLCSSTEVDAPVVIGFFAPRLLLPETLAESIDGRDLEQIALHEMEHLRRRDDWVNLLQKLALAVFPLHPALLWIDRRLSEERELACDAGVVARTAAPVRYAACLTRLAEHRLRGRVAALALAAWSRRAELVRRVETLLQSGCEMSAAQTRWAMGLLLVGLTAGAAAMACAPEMVSLAEPAGQSLAQVSARETARAAGPRVLSSQRAGVPVVYREGGSRAGAGAAAHEAHMVEAKFVAPASSPSTAVPRGRVSRGRAAASKAAAGEMKRLDAQPPRADAQPRMLQIGAAARGESKRVRRAGRTGETGELPAAPAYTLLIQHVPSYAAVPFGDGWILVQL